MKIISSWSKEKNCVTFQSSIKVSFTFLLFLPSSLSFQKFSSMHLWFLLVGQLTNQVANWNVHNKHWIEMLKFFFVCFFFLHLNNKNNNSNNNINNQYCSSTGCTINFWKKRDIISRQKKKIELLFSLLSSN